SNRARLAPLPPARARDTLPAWRASIIACPVMLDLRHLAANSLQPRTMKHADAVPTASLALRALKFRMHEYSRILVPAHFLPLTRVGHGWVGRPPGTRALAGASDTDPPEAESDEPGRQIPQHRYVQEQPRQQRQAGRPPRSLPRPEHPGHDDSLRQRRRPLHDARRPLPPALHFGQVTEPHPPGPKRDGEHVRRLHPVPNGVLDPAPRPRSAVARAGTSDGSGSRPPIAARAGASPSGTPGAGRGAAPRR